MMSILRTTVLTAALIEFVLGNLYFPELYEDALYKPGNLGPLPMIYQTTSNANTTIVEWSMNDNQLFATGRFSEDNGDVNCRLARANFSALNPDECKSVQNAILTQENTYVVSVHCKLKNRVILVRLSSSCLPDHVTFDKFEIVYTSFDNKRELLLNVVGNKTSSILVWLRHSQFYSIIEMNEWPLNTFQLESNLVIGELQNELKVIDVSAAYGILYVFVGTCVYWCSLAACRDLDVVPESCVLTPNNETVSGLIKNVNDGERLFVLDKFTILSAESHSYQAFFSVYCTGRLTHRMFKCGGFGVQDIVMTFNMNTRTPADYFPCSISHEGSLIACLILGEPRIFDISDRKSAYPISAFSVSAWRLGVAINRFGFASSDIFFFEIVPSLTANPRGFIFNVRAELQPALIASRLLYPSLATSITPAESFILVSHQSRDIWLFSHGGRLFYRDGSKENALSIDFEYAEAYSFFIADTLSTAGVNHNFEHPFAFFSPDGGSFAYLSYYRSPYGAFSASAITVTNASKADLRSIVSISDKLFIIQAGIDPLNDVLLAVQKLSSDYLTVQIFKISDMPQMSYNMTGIVTQAEVKGSWTWDEFDAVESTRIWVIYFSDDRKFIMASHVASSVATELFEYKINTDYTIELHRNHTIKNCLAITNYNDYLRQMIVVLCAETPLSNVVNQTYHIAFVEANGMQQACQVSIDHKFGSLLSKYDDLQVTNIPIFDYNEIAQRLVVSFEKTVLMYATDVCPFRLLYRFDHTDLIAGIGNIHTGQDHKPFGITFVTYLQKVDLIGDCINGYGLDTVLPRNYFCSRCTPGHVGLGCRQCPAGFYCSDYSQLQPSGACPEGFYCLEGTSTSNPMADVLDKTATPPHLCPAGAYCPAGTAKGSTNDESANAPQSCLAGFFCPLGSVRPTQEKCPENATSLVGAKVIEECYCKPNFFGSALTRCMPCLPGALCIGGSQNVTNSSLVIPPGYWPDTPNNAGILVKCFVTMSRFTPCKGCVCKLQCPNRTNFEDDRTLNCVGACTDPCEDGHTGRLCSACKSGYYRKSPYHCAPCAMGPKQTVCVALALLSSLLILTFYFVRKHRGSNGDIQPDRVITDGQILEVLITVLLVILGISSTASVLFMVFIVVIVYLQQLRSPPYATLIFIFYIQTLQALLQGNFVWPAFMQYVLQFLEIMYAPVPGLACLPNFYTGENLGWEGAFLLIFSLPVILGILIAAYIFVTGSVKKRPVWQRAFLSYCLFISVLQFPLSNMSLSTLSCRPDLISNKLYMSSQPWKECDFTSLIQICGVFGTVFYFMGIPFILHYWYFKKVFPEPIHSEIGNMFIPGGIAKHDLFVIFLTVRWMLMSIILSFVPFTWGLQRPLLTGILIANIMFTTHLNPYEKYLPREPTNLSLHERKWFEKLVKSMSGNFLDLATLLAILFSYTALDFRDNYEFLQLKSFVIGIVNLIICFYFIIFILLEDRLSLFPKIAKSLARIEELTENCLTCIKNLRNKTLHTNDILEEDIYSKTPDKCLSLKNMNST